MLGRYNNDPDMAHIWTDGHRYGLWLLIEDRVMNYHLGEAGKKSVGLMGICDGITDPILHVNWADKVADYEKITGHEMTAFLRVITDLLPEYFQNVPLHKGITSSDVMDTALSVQMREAGVVLDRNITKLMTALGNKILDTDGIICIGRTHGQHAIPTLFMNRLRVYAEQIKAICASMSAVRLFGKMSGPIGTHNEIDSKTEEIILLQLGLSASPASTQIVSRIYYANALFGLALLASGLEKMAVDIRLMSQPELGEVEEFGRGIRDGSSAMPHKHNPIKCEQICSLARRIRACIPVALENISTWFERDLTNSANERIMIPEAYILTNHIVNVMTRVIETLVIHEDRMWENVASSPEIMKTHIFNENMMKGDSRSEAYRKAKLQATEQIDRQTIINAYLRGIQE